MIIEQNAAVSASLAGRKFSPIVFNASVNGNESVFATVNALDHHPIIVS